MTVTIPSTSKNSKKLAGITPSSLGLSLLQSTNNLSVSSGTVTSNTPILNLSQTWNNAGVAFTGLKFDVTDSNSASGSLLADFQIGGSSKFSVRKDGVLTTGKVAASGSYVYSAPQFYSSTYGTNVGMQIKANNEIAFYCSGTAVASVNYNSGITLGSTNSIGWVNGHAIANPPDLFLYRDAADTLALRNGVNPQTLNIYNTYTNATTYERLSFLWSGNTAWIYTNKGSVGGTSRNLVLGVDGNSSILLFTNGVSRWQVNGSGQLYAYADNSYDIGASSSNRPRTGYFGTSVVTPNVTFGNGTILTDDAANTLALRNGVNAQVFRTYGTYTDSGNYNRGMIGVISNNFIVGTEQAGTGSTMQMQFRVGGTDRWTVKTSGILAPGANNTYDIGVAATNTVKNIYVGTSVVSPTFVATSPQTYATTNVTTDRTYDANATTVDELADIVGTLISDLRTLGLVA